MPRRERPPTPKLHEADVDDIIRRGDRVEFRAYLRTATRVQASMASIKANRAGIPDMVEAAEARLHGDPIP